MQVGSKASATFALGMVALAIVSILMSVFTASRSENSITEYNGGTDNKIHSNVKPTFVLHVGPPKTGTTAIQTAMSSPEIRNLLATDHYSVIPHSIMHQDRNHHLLKSHKLEQLELIDELVQTMNSFRVIPGQHVVGSSEFLYHPQPQECELWKRTFMEEQDWNLQIILSYRRLHRLLPSTWNQFYKILHEPNGSIILDENGHSRKHKDWPNVNNDYKILPFEDWFLEKYSRFYPEEKDLTIFEESYSAWKECSDGIEVFNMDASRVMLGDGRIVDADADHVINFICSSLKGAKHTCDELMPDVERKRRLTNNAFENLDYDILAVHAYENGLISVLHQRNDVKRAIRDHVERNNVTLPQKCPSKDVLDYIYEWSLQVERWIGALSNSQQNSTSEGLSPSQLSEFQGDWDDMMDEKKLCNVDLVKVLDQDIWQKFFRNRFQ